MNFDLEQDFDIVSALMATLSQYNPKCARHEKNVWAFLIYDYCILIARIKME